MKTMLFHEIEEWVIKSIFEKINSTFAYRLRESSFIEIHEERGQETAFSYRSFCFSFIEVEERLATNSRKKHSLRDLLKLRNVFRTAFQPLPPPYIIDCN